MKVAVVGCGNIGTKRIRALEGDSGADIAALVDAAPARREWLARTWTAPVAADYQPFLRDRSIESVIVSTPPKAAYAIVMDSLRAGKHVLCEKPLGRSVEEARLLTSAALEQRVVLKCGFNLRHDEGLNRAFELLRTGTIGQSYFLKCAYVNGTVLVNANGVGSLLDMGIHTLDLARWFLGEITSVYGKVSRSEYPIDSLDDNGFAIVSAGSVIGEVHFSFVRWCNDFRLEISGAKGMIEVENLPKWGPQTVRCYRRVYPSGVPDVQSMTFESDRSWANEWLEFRRCLAERDMRWNRDGLTAMELAQALRTASDRGVVQQVPKAA